MRTHVTRWIVRAILPALGAIVAFGLLATTADAAPGRGPAPTDPAEACRRVAQAGVSGSLVERCRHWLADSAPPAPTAAELCRRVAQADAAPGGLVERCRHWLAGSGVAEERPGRDAQRERPPAVRSGQP